MSADQKSRRGVDLVALLAGLLFLAFSIISTTVGVLDLPRLGAAPLWLVLIGAGVLLLVSELRERKNRQPDTAQPSETPELGAWDQDPYR